jgi:hypothetical protein
MRVSGDNKSTMAEFKMTDLKLNYLWEMKEDTAKRISGFPGDIILNCTEGYEMLHFLNRYMTDIGWVTLVSFNNLERLVMLRLPLGKRSHNDVKEWLDILLKIKR